MKNEEIMLELKTSFEDYVQLIHMIDFIIFADNKFSEGENVSLYEMLRDKVIIGMNKKDNSCVIDLELTLEEYVKLIRLIDYYLYACCVFEDGTTNFICIDLQNKILRNAKIINK